ncbi:virulence factor Mce-like protein [Prauserella shujinwangii]|uniref:Virulence factor Mce-like protein n=1 Tax=Prauserella shujinwangii TaxID=1453103 RepID=A0A2T0LS33_9PSEU|nr:MCE family protein [Prauserella shujinwangii]PRX46468.1 virulence factor Mce-like protein [Prauserella shujinwangii]
MNPARTDVLRRLRHQVLGLAFLLVAALFIALCVAVYEKAFVSAVSVRLETDRVGNQMREGADVKVRGMVVGEVRAIGVTRDGAVLDLALRPDKVDVIPANVSARLLPKTLFGERYVALRVPERPSPRRIAEGDVIGQDRSSSAIELERVLGNVLPLLRSVQPQKLASTLNAVSTALEGRGERLGDTLVRISDYLGELNPSLPDLKADITGLANVTGTYTDAAPDFLRALSDLTTTSRTIVDRQRDLAGLYASVGTAATDLRRFLEVNQDNLIDLTVTAQPTLDLLAKYAPEYPCLLRQLAEAVPRAERAFGKGTDEMNHVTIRITASRGKYLPGVDEPRYEDKRGPRCYEQVEPPGAFPQYPPGGPVQDGSAHPAPPRRAGYSGGGSTAGVPSIANSAAEHRLLSVLLAPRTGLAPAETPGWAGLLVGPLYRGAEVIVE